MSWSRDGQEWVRTEQTALSVQGVRLQLCGGDDRRKAETAVKRAFAVILYALGKSSYGCIAKLLGVTPAAVQKWLQREAALLDEPEIAGAMCEMEFDELWHFIGAKQTNRGSFKPWIVLQSDPWPGLSAVVMLQPSSGSMRKSNI